MTDREAKGMAALLARAEVDGVGILSFPSDSSYLLCFGREKLVEILAAMDKAGQEQALVLVKRGPSVDSLGD